MAPEKKLATLSLKDGGVAPLGAEAAGAVLVEAVVAGAPVPPPLHPASKTKASAAPAGDRWRQPDMENARCLPCLIAKFAIPACYSKTLVAFPNALGSLVKAANNHALP